MVLFSCSISLLDKDCLPSLLLCSWLPIHCLQKVCGCVTLPVPPLGHAVSLLATSSEIFPIVPEVLWDFYVKFWVGIFFFKHVTSL